ncbi:MAG TPA: MoaD/ThiS family protein [Gemmatimonadaceae bacterium]
MTIDLLLFASASDALGARSVRLELPEKATVADLRRALASLPGADRIPARSMVARNRVYARDADPVAPGDELALIPPVSGG